MDLLPMRCFTCNKLLASKTIQYDKMLEGGALPQIALDKLSIVRECCRRMFLCRVQDVTAGYPVYEGRIQYVAADRPMVTHRGLEFPKSKFNSNKKWLDSQLTKGFCIGCRAPTFVGDAPSNSRISNSRGTPRGAKNPGSKDGGTEGYGCLGCSYYYCEECAANYDLEPDPSRWAKTCQACKHIKGSEK